MLGSGRKAPQASATGVAHRSADAATPHAAADRASNRTRPAGTLDGASQAAAAGETARRGKSGHRRARWSGHRPGETRGKVPQKHTADGEASRGSRTGKGEKVR